MSAAGCVPVMRDINVTIPRRDRDTHSTRTYSQTVMSLAKTALRAVRPRAVYFSCGQHRNASSGSHGHDEHHNTDAASYPEEGMTFHTHDISYCPSDVRGVAQDFLQLAGRTHLLLR